MEGKTQEDLVYDEGGFNGLMNILEWNIRQNFRKENKDAVILVRDRIMANHKWLFEEKPKIIVTFNVDDFTVLTWAYENALDVTAESKCGYFGKTGYFKEMLEEDKRRNEKRDTK